MSIRKTNLRSNEVTIVLPALSKTKASETVELLRHRAGMEANYVIAVDHTRAGFIATVNRVAQSCPSDYVVYLAEDAFPGSRWLWHAYQRVQSEQLDLLAFNDGKWEGKIASFGMVRLSWSRGLYGSGVFFSEYLSHRADKELTIIAKAQGRFGYSPEATLVEYDTRKPFRVRERDNPNFDPKDRDLFNARVRTGFGGILSTSEMRLMMETYPELSI